jgi:FkbM family methyltransferase
MAWSFRDGRYYEHNLEHWLLLIAARLDGPVVYDIGANCGYYSVLLSRTARQVFAFEPSARTRAALAGNVGANDLFNVVVVPLGLSSRDSQATLNTYTSSGNNSMVERTIPAGHSLRRTGAEDIEVRTLDSWVAETGAPLPDLVKIDVEGAELWVLEGGAEVLRRSQPVIFVEYSATTSDDAGYRREQISDTLRGYGYVLMALSEDADDLTLRDLDAGADVEVSNLVALPPAARHLITAEVDS